VTPEVMKSEMFASDDRRRRTVLVVPTLAPGSTVVGLRLRADATDNSSKWEVSRIGFMDKDNMEVKPQDYGCKVVSSGYDKEAEEEKEMLKEEEMLQLNQNQLEHDSVLGTESVHAKVLATPNCRNWCATPKKPWTRKCKLKFCKGCEDCKLEHSEGEGEKGGEADAEQLGWGPQNALENNGAPWRGNQGDNEFFFVGFDECNKSLPDLALLHLNKEVILLVQSLCRGTRAKVPGRTLRMPMSSPRASILSESRRRL